jgi:uncharacterized protein (DUF952 family)
MRPLRPPNCRASPDDHYRCASLDHEGFIHCSMREQVVEVAGRLFQGRRDVVLFVIDPELVTAEIDCEDGGNGNFYPHILWASQCQRRHRGRYF